VEAPRFNAAYLNNPTAAYPLAARRRGIEGRVMVRAEVLADGTCNRVELKKTSGFEPTRQHWKRSGNGASPPPEEATNPSPPGWKYRLPLNWKI
jgi:TonB family protein